MGNNKDKDTDWQNELMGKKLGDTSDHTVCIIHHTHHHDLHSTPSLSNSSRGECRDGIGQDIADEIGALRRHSLRRTCPRRRASSRRAT